MIIEVSGITDAQVSIDTCACSYVIRFMSKVFLSI